jgi:AcrR family transcriptional regulator
MPPASLPDASTRRLRQRREARQVILDAAEEILVSGGYASFSMRKLAARCGYTAPTIYHYFGDKPGLLDALVEHRMSELVVQVRAVRIGPDPVENMRELFLAFARWGLENPTHYQLLTAMRDPEAEPHPTGEMVRAMLERPIAELETRCRLDADVETVRQAFWALVHGLVSLQRTRPDVDWSEGLVERSLGAMIDGLVRPESKPR